MFISYPPGKTQFKQVIFITEQVQKDKNTRYQKDLTLKYVPITRTTVTKNTYSADILYSCHTYYIVS